MKQKRLNGKMSLLLAVIMLLNCIIIPFSVFDTEAFETDDIWAVPKNVDGIVSAANVKSWWGSVFTLTELSDGGLHFDWRIDAKGVRQGMLDTFSLDGLTMKFDKLSRTENTAGVFAILLSGRPDKMDPGNAAYINDSAVITVDTIKGQLRFENDAIVANNWSGIGTVLLESELLKYENLSGKPFSIAFKKGTVSGSFDVSVKTEDETASRANALTAAMLSKVNAITDTDYLFAAVSSWGGSNGLSVDYLAAGPYRKSEATLNIPDVNNLTVTLNEISMWWPNFIRVSSAQGGGLHYELTNAFANVRDGVNQTVMLNGMRLSFDRLVSRNNVMPSLGIVLSNTDARAEAKNGMLGFCIDTSTGELRQAYSADFQQYKVIAKDDRLKADNIIGRPFSFLTARNEDGTYRAIVRIADYDAVEGNIDLTLSPNFDANMSAYASIMAGCKQSNSQSFNVDYLEIGTVTATVTSVEAAINAIGEVKLSNGNLIREAQELYNQLSKSEKASVSNYSLLEQAQSKYKELAAEDDLGMTWMSRENGKHLGSKNEFVQKTVNVDWADKMSFEDINGGGLRYIFNSSIPDIREGYKERLVLDGLLMKFDNLEADSGELCSFSLYIGNYTGDYGPGSANSLSFVLDPNQGAIYAYPVGQKLITDENLKLENISKRRFSYLFNYDDDNNLELIVSVNGRELKGVVSDQVLAAATGFTDPSACEIMISNWKKNSTYKVDFLGFERTKATAGDVVELIDAIGLVKIDSGSAIETAENAYNGLSTSGKQNVYNYTVLTAARNYFDRLYYENMVITAEDAVNEIGQVTYKSGSAIEAAASAIMRLNAKQLSELSNYDTYKAAVVEYNRITRTMLEIENYTNGFYNANNTVRIANDAIDSWIGKMFANVTDDGIMHLEFNNAIRDMRNGPKEKFELDGLYIRWAGLTKEQGLDGAKLSVQIGEEADYSPAVANVSMAFVFDTSAGTLTAFPGNKRLAESKLLKHSNIENKEVSMKFTATDEFLYKLTVKIGDDILECIVPSSVTMHPNVGLNKYAVKVALSPWVNNDEARSDLSEHTFKVDLLSVQSTGKYAYEDFYEMIDLINMLPAEISKDDILSVEEANERYLSFSRFLKSKVTNYSRLAAALNQMYELERDDYSEWDSSDNTDSAYEISSETGDNSRPILYVTLAAVSLLSVLLVIGCKSRQKNVSGKGEDLV